LVSPLQLVCDASHSWGKIFEEAAVISIELETSGLRELVAAYEATPQRVSRVIARSLNRAA
jgi:hypothetical protein